jgi:Mg2+/Co2+ transporter CorB
LKNKWTKISLEDDLDRNLPNLIKSLIRKKPHRDIKLPEGECESVGGFIIHLLGKIPKVGEQIVFEDLEMTIKSADVRKIDKILITLQSPYTPTEKRRGQH